jgi:hypothetical protein
MFTRSKEIAATTPTETVLIEDQVANPSELR